MTPRRFLISACLLGLDCRYSGKPNQALSDQLNPLLQQALERGVVFIPVCPEQLGGLPTPRPPSELLAPAEEILSGNGRVINNQGVDVTLAFVKGAQESLRLARFFGAQTAIFKAKSPSCGSGLVYSGEFNGRLVSGDGATTALLKKQGLSVITEEDLLKGTLSIFY